LVTVPPVVIVPVPEKLKEMPAAPIDPDPGSDGNDPVSPA
jgi:hypothetical protein